MELKLFECASVMLEEVKMYKCQNTYFAFVQLGNGLNIYRW